MPAKKKTAKKAPKVHEEEEGETLGTIKKAKATVKALFGEAQILTENSDAARDLHNTGSYGDLEDGQLRLSLIEALYLTEKGKVTVYDGRNKPYTPERYVKRAKRLQPKFWVRYTVYKDMRDRGYILKTALKFGADFRVYDRGVKPGEDHARWVLYPVHEGETLTWHEFAAKNRVAHSTKKRLMLAVVDDENDVTYWEVGWTRP